MEGDHGMPGADQEPWCRGRGRVFVASPADGNPFPAGSEDACDATGDAGHAEQVSKAITVGAEAVRKQQSEQKTIEAPRVAAGPLTSSLLTCPQLTAVQSTITLSERT